MYQLPKSVAELRTKMRQEFERHRYVSQLPVVDVLLFQCDAEYQETLNYWKQLPHVMKYFRAEEDPSAKLPQNFISGFLEVRQSMIVKVPCLSPIGTKLTTALRVFQYILAEAPRTFVACSRFKGDECALSVNKPPMFNIYSIMSCWATLRIGYRTSIHFIVPEAVRFGT